MAELNFNEVPKLDDQVCFALTVATRSVVGLYRPLLEPLGLTHPQYLVMMTLWEQSPRSMRELGEVLSQDAPALSPVLKRLEQAGLITRSRNAADERHLMVTLTEKGSDLREDAKRIPEAIINKLGMPIEDLEQLRGILWQVIEGAR